jgi:hypothetical protein
MPMKAIRVKYLNVTGESKRYFLSACTTRYRRMVSSGLLRRVALQEPHGVTTQKNGVF